MPKRNGFKIYRKLRQANPTSAPNLLGNLRALENASSMDLGGPATSVIDAGMQGHSDFANNWLRAFSTVHSIHT